MHVTVCDFCNRTIDTDGLYGEITLHDASKGVVHNAIYESKHLHICEDCLKNYGAVKTYKT